MATAAVVLLFLLMLTAPCVLALHSAEQGDQPDPAVLREPLEVRGQPEAVEPISPIVPPLTRAEAAAQAELEAMIAQDLARDAHWAALAAAARAARLRADAAAEAAAEAGLAAAQAMAELDADFPLFDLPPARARRQAA